MIVGPRSSCRISPARTSACISDSVSPRKQTSDGTGVGPVPEEDPLPGIGQRPRQLADAGRVHVVAAARRDRPRPAGVAEQLVGDGEPVDGGSRHRATVPSLPDVRKRSLTSDRDRSATGSAAVPSAARRDGRPRCTTRLAASPWPRWRWRRRAEVADVVKVAVDAAETWGATPLSRRVPMLFRLRELLDGHRDDLAEDHHERARQGPRRRARRGRPRHRVRRVRVRHPDAARRLDEPGGRHRCRRPHRARAGRGRGRHHAVQLPGDGAALDDGERPRLRQRLHPQAVGEGPVGLAAAGRAGARGRVPRRRVQRRSRETPRRSRRC